MAELLGLNWENKMALVVETIGSVAIYDGYVKSCEHTLGYNGVLPDWTTCPVMGIRMRLNKDGKCVTLCERNTNPRYQKANTAGAVDDQHI